MPSDAAEMHTEPAPKRNGKARLLTLDALDKRTKAASATLEVRDNLLSDLGGKDHVSTANRELVTHAAVIGAMLADYETRWLRGEPIELTDYLAATNAQRRLLATVGLERRQRDITPSLAEYVAQNYPARDDSADPDGADEGLADDEDGPAAVSVNGGDG